MTAVYERLQNCYESIRDKISIRPKIALVLDSDCLHSGLP